MYVIEYLFKKNIFIIQLRAFFKINNHKIKNVMNITKYCKLVNYFIFSIKNEI